MQLRETLRPRSVPAVRTSFVIPFVIFGVVLVVIVVAARLAEKKAAANMAKLAARLGLGHRIAGKFIKKHSLAGELRGRPAEVYKYTTGSGKSQQTWVALAVTVRKTGGLTFSIERKLVFLEFVARMFRRNEAKTGDVEFDKAWLLKTNQPDFMRAALLPELRQKIDGLVASGARAPNFKLEICRVVYSEQGLLSTEAVCDRIAQAVDVVCDLGDVVEVGAEMKDPRA